MFVAKLKSAAAVLLLIGVVGLGAGALLNSTIAGTQAPIAAAGEQPAPAEGAKPARPEDEGKFAEPLGLRGTIHAIDGSKNPASVTINVGEDGKVQLSLDLARNARVFVAGKPAALADLKPETDVVLVLGADKRTVAQVEARGRIVEGKLVRVDAAASTLTVQEDDDENNQTQTVTIGKDVAVFIDGYRGRLADLEDCKDRELELELVADEKSVARILAAWKQEGDHEGEITQIDAAAGELTVRVEEDDVANDFKVKVAAASKIFVNGQPGKLADLQVGWKATLRGDGATVKTMRVVKRAAEADADDD